MGWAHSQLILNKKIMIVLIMEIKGSDWVELIQSSRVLLGYQWQQNSLYPQGGRFCEENFLRYLGLCYVNPTYYKLKTSLLQTVNQYQKFQEIFIAKSVSFGVAKGYFAAIGTPTAYDNFVSIQPNRIQPNFMPDWHSGLMSWLSSMLTNAL